MNNHAKLRTRLMEEGFPAAQIDAAMDEMWNSNLPYDEYDQVYKYLKEAGGGESKPQSTRRTTTTKKITDEDGVGETNEEVDEPKSAKSPKLAKSGKSAAQQPKKDPNSMASRLDLVAGFENLSDAIFAMKEWITRAAKPNDLEELCASVETVALSRIIRRSIVESKSQSDFDSSILPSMDRLLESLLQKCGMPADGSGIGQSFPSILKQTRKVYQMEKAGSEGVPQRVAEFMVARMYVVLKETREASSDGLNAKKLLQTPASNGKSKSNTKKGFAAVYKERETHRIVAKQFGSAALASCRAITPSNNNNGRSNIASTSDENDHTDIFSVFIDEDTNAAFHQHESMYTELKAQVTQEESKEENQALVELRAKHDAIQTERDGLAEKIAALQASIAQLEDEDQNLVANQFKIQEKIDNECNYESIEAKKLNEALQEASLQLQSDEFVRTLVHLLKDFDDALAKRSVQAISLGASAQENASKAMDMYLIRAKTYFESEANLFQLLQKRIVTNKTSVSGMKQEIEMLQGLGMDTTITQMEEDIRSMEIALARDKSLVSRIRSDSSTMLDELMVWLEEYKAARDADEDHLDPISTKTIRGIPTDVSKLEVPNGDRLDAFLAIHDIVSIQPPPLPSDQSEAADRDAPDQTTAGTQRASAPKFTWAAGGTTAETKTNKSLLDIQREEMESKKKVAEKAEAEVAEDTAKEKEKDVPLVPSQAQSGKETPAEPEVDKAVEPEAAEATKEVEKGETLKEEVNAAEEEAPTEEAVVEKEKKSRDEANAEEKEAPTEEATAEVAESEADALPEEAPKEIPAEEVASEEPATEKEEEDEKDVEEEGKAATPAEDKAAASGPAAPSQARSPLIFPSLLPPPPPEHRTSFPAFWPEKEIDLGDYVEQQGKQ